MQLCTNHVDQRTEDVGAQTIVDATDLSDDALASGGLRKVSAYVRTEASANAKRVKKAREKAGESGKRQINVMVPATAHGAIRELAKELNEGANYRDALERLLLAESKPGDPRAVVRVVNVQTMTALENLERRINSFRGWRRFLVKLLRLL